MKTVIWTLFVDGLGGLYSRKGSPLAANFEGKWDPYLLSEELPPGVLGFRTMESSVDVANDGPQQSTMHSAPKETEPLDPREEWRNEDSVPGRDRELKEEEFVLLDLDEVFHGAGLPPNCPYTLSGLDTMNPILTLGGSGLRLVGDYEETVGTCLVFTESVEKVQQDASEHPQPGSTAQTPSEVKRKRVNGLCTLTKKLKFRLLDASEKPSEKVL